jgi:hypothetical protein
VTPRTFWAPWRRPGPVEAFRVVVGAAIALHFTRHLLETVPLLRGVALGRVPAAWTPALAVAGLVLALAVALGVAARVSAALLFGVSLAMHRAIAPIAFVDDATACAASLALSLMPVGSAARVFAPRARAPEGVLGGGVAVWLAQVAGLYLSGGLGDLCGAGEGARPALTLVTRFLPAAFIVPNPVVQAAGVIAQLGLHAYLAATTPALLTNAVLASTAILFWGEPRRSGALGWAIDGAAAASLLVGVLVGASVMAAALGLPGVGAPRILSDAGMLPAFVGVPVEPPNPWTITIGDTATGSETDPVPTSGLRSRLLAVRLAADGPRALRDPVVAALAARDCRSPRHWGQRGTMGSAGDLPSFEFECDERGGVASLDALDPR